MRCSPWKSAARASDEVTEAVSGYLLRSDEARDHWRGSSDRPPSEASEFTATYLALRALAAYGKDVQKGRIDGRVAKARQWLQSTRPKDTEDRVFRVLALEQASASQESIREAADELLATRRADGGWSQLDGGTSDAYATGTALVGLHLAGGLATDSPAYRGGLRFLIASQTQGWVVVRRLAQQTVPTVFRERVSLRQGPVHFDGRKLLVGNGDRDGVPEKVRGRSGVQLAAALPLVCHRLPESNGCKGQLPVPEPARRRRSTAAEQSG